MIFFGLVFVMIMCLIFFFFRKNLTDCFSEWIDRYRSSYSDQDQQTM